MGDHLHSSLSAVDLSEGWLRFVYSSSLTVNRDGQEEAILHKTAPSSDRGSRDDDSHAVATL